MGQPVVAGSRLRGGHLPRAHPVGSHSAVQWHHPAMRPWERPAARAEVQAVLDVLRWALTIAAWATSFDRLIGQNPAWASPLALVWTTFGFVLTMYAVGLLMLPFYGLMARLVPREAARRGD